MEHVHIQPCLQWHYNLQRLDSAARSDSHISPPFTSSLLAGSLSMYNILFIYPYTLAHAATFQIYFPVPPSGSSKGHKRENVISLSEQLKVPLIFHYWRLPLKYELVLNIFMKCAFSFPILMWRHDYSTFFFFKGLIDKIKHILRATELWKQNFKDSYSNVDNHGIYEQNCLWFKAVLALLQFIHWCSQLSSVWVGPFHSKHSGDRKMLLILHVLQAFCI